jgi:glycosyltransferase involved in cell wall biosynthesis
VPDVIHAHIVLPAGWAAVELGKLHRIPVVLTEHTSPFSIHLRTGWMQSRVEATLARCEAVIAVSHGLAKQVAGAMQGGSVEVIGNVLDVPAGPTNPASPRAPGRIRIGFVGGLREQKGVVFLLGAVARLEAMGHDVEVVLAGDGPLRALLEHEARTRGIAARCSFVGALSRPAVYEVLAASDLLVVPSLHETFCLAAAEALALGKPVVATRCGGPEGFVGPECGCIVEPGDEDALAEGIREVVGRLGTFDPAALRKKVLARFGPAAFLDRTTAVYRRAVAEGLARCD